MSDYTSLLFAEPSFLEGMARIFDFGNFMNEYNTADDPDSIAIASDWRAIGLDIQYAIEEFNVKPCLRESEAHK